MVNKGGDTPIMIVGLIIVTIWIGIIWKLRCCYYSAWRLMITSLRIVHSQYFKNDFYNWSQNR